MIDDSASLQDITLERCAGKTATPEWRPSATLAVLKRRAALLAEVRRFFSDRGVLEVETPLLSSSPGLDAHIRSIEARATFPGSKSAARLFLQISPEYFMKRLLAADLGPHYQICKAFRDGESGRYHNPEFTLLEWYRPGFDGAQLMVEVEAFFRSVLAIPSFRRMTYRDAFQRYAGFDPFQIPDSELKTACVETGISPETVSGLDRDSCLDLVLTQRIQPGLADSPTFLMDYPASQAALARIRSGDVPVAERFELFVNGLELANGYHELRDAEEQEQRLRAERDSRAGRSQPLLPLDERFLNALRHGLPQCSGVAVGFDRLVMLAVGAQSLDQVLAFPATLI